MHHVTFCRIQVNEKSTNTSNGELVVNVVIDTG